MQGLVIKINGNTCQVLGDDSSNVTAVVKGNFRIRGIRTTNPVAVGDRVSFSPSADGATPAFITAIEPRRNYIIRRASNLSKESHILAANIDLAALVISLAHPVTQTTFMDRFLATAEAYRVPAVIIINKIDLLTEPEGRELIDAITYLYTSIGYGVIPVSAHTGEGLGILRDRLAGCTTLLSGNSGVGKSTLINDLIPGLNLRTARISDSHDQGMHTTTFSQMFAIPDLHGSFIIDTPGVRGFGTIEMQPDEVSHYFPEIFSVGRDCRYGDCTHTHEPGCAVLRALDEQRIAASRYASYLSILREDTAHDKYRKPH